MHVHEIDAGAAHTNEHFIGFWDWRWQLAVLHGGDAAVVIDLDGFQSIYSMLIAQNARTNNFLYRSF
jgi:hypothetical protein